MKRIAYALVIGTLVSVSAFGSCPLEVSAEVLWEASEALNRGQIEFILLNSDHTFGYALLLVAGEVYFIKSYGTLAEIRKLRRDDSALSIFFSRLSSRSFLDSLEKLGGGVEAWVPGVRTAMSLSRSSIQAIGFQTTEERYSALYGNLKEVTTDNWRSFSFAVLGSPADSRLYRRTVRGNSTLAANLGIDAALVGFWALLLQSL